MGISKKITELVDAYKQSLEENPTSSKPLDALIDVEQALITYLRSSSQEKVDAVLKGEIDQILIENGLNTINGFLDEISYRVERILQDSNNRESESLDSILDRLKITHRKVLEVIVEPIDLEANIGGGWTNSEIKEYGTKKLRLLIGLLRTLDIFTDDLLVITGENRPEMQRKGSYLIIEIPKVNRSILSHLGYGEATFVIKGIYDRHTVSTLDKIELVEQLEAKKIIFNEQEVEKWKIEILEALDLKNQAELKDIDLESFDRRQHYIAEIKKRWAMPEEFMKLTSIQKLDIKINGFGLTAVAAFITGKKGLKVNSRKDATAFVAKEVYGAGHMILEVELWDKAKWISEIKKLFPTSEDLMGMTSSQREDIEIYGKKIDYIKNRITGTKRLPQLKARRDMAVFAQDIYGEGHEVIEQCFKEKEGDDWTREKWIEELKKQVSDVHVFMGLTQDELLDIRVGGKGAHAIATIIMGYSNVEITNSLKNRALLAKEVYGEDHDVINSLLWTSEVWMEKVKEKYPSPVELWKLNSAARQKVRIATKSFTFICREIFPDQPNLEPMFRTIDFKTLIQGIYGESIELPKPPRRIKDDFTTDQAVPLKRPSASTGSESNEEVKKKQHFIDEIIELYPTAEDFMNANQIDVKIDGKGFQKLAWVILNRQGFNPMSNPKNKAEFALEVYGSGHEVIDIMFWPAEEWKEAIKKEYTKEALLKFTTPVIRSLEFKGKRASALYTLVCGLDSESIYRIPIWLKFVAEVYDEELDSIKELKRSLHLGRTPNKTLKTPRVLSFEKEEVIDAIKMQVAKPETFMSMNLDDIAEINVLGEKFGLIGSYYGFMGGFKSGSINIKRAEWALMIYGEGHKIIDCEFWTPDQWVEEIKLHVSTPEKFKEMKETAFRDFIVLNRKVTALLTCIGLTSERNPAGSLEKRSEMARRIYGKGHDIIECEFWTSKQWIERIVSKYPTSEEWMALTQPQKNDILILGKGIMNLATYIGVTGSINPYRSKKEQAQMGKVLYGKGHDIIDCELWNGKRWAEEIKKMYPNEADFKAIPVGDRKHFKLHGKKLIAISRFFGITRKMNSGITIEDFNIIATAIYK